MCSQCGHYTVHTQTRLVNMFGMYYDVYICVNNIMYTQRRYSLTLRSSYPRTGFRSMNVENEIKSGENKKIVVSDEPSTLPINNSRST